MAKSTTSNTDQHGLTKTQVAQLAMQIAWGHADPGSEQQKNIEAIQDQLDEKAKEEREAKKK